MQHQMVLVAFVVVLLHGTMYTAQAEVMPYPRHIMIKGQIPCVIERIQKRLRQNLVLS